MCSRRDSPLYLFGLIFSAEVASSPFITPMNVFVSNGSWSLATLSGVSEASKEVDWPAYQAVYRDPTLPEEVRIRRDFDWSVSGQDEYSLPRSSLSPPIRVVVVNMALGSTSPVTTQAPSFLHSSTSCSTHTLLHAQPLVEAATMKRKNSVHSSTHQGQAGSWQGLWLNPLYTTFLRL